MQRRRKMIKKIANKRRREKYRPMMPGD